MAVTTRIRHALLLVVIAVLALGAGLVFSPWFGSALSGQDQAATALTGLTLPDLDGKEQPLAQWRGKVLVVNFWATWCAPCREEMPEFVKAQRELGPKGLQFVGIGIDDAAKLRLFADEIGLNYPALVGGYGALELSKALGNNLLALPFTVVLDRSGQVVHTQLGTLKPATLAKLVGQLL
jgi:thiol-disulfide isomerase/thioredoxin